MSIRAERVRATVLHHRADEAFRISRDTDHCTEIHQRLIEVERVSRRNQRAGNGPQLLLHRVALGVTLADEDPKQDARYVRVENGGPLSEGKAADGARGVCADSLEGQQSV